MSYSKDQTARVWKVDSRHHLRLPLQGAAFVASAGRRSCRAAAAALVGKCVAQRQSFARRNTKPTWMYRGAAFGADGKTIFTLETGAPFGPSVLVKWEQFDAVGAVGGDEGGDAPAASLDGVSWRPTTKAVVCEHTAGCLSVSPEGSAVAVGASAGSLYVLRTSDLRVVSRSSRTHEAQCSLQRADPLCDRRRCARSPCTRRGTRCTRRA